MKSSKKARTFKITRSTKEGEKTYNIEYDPKYWDEGPKGVIPVYEKNEELGNLVLTKIFNELSLEIEVNLAIKNTLEQNYIEKKIEEYETEIQRITSNLSIEPNYIKELFDFLTDYSDIPEMIMHSTDKSLGHYIYFISRQLDRLFKYHPWIEDDLSELSKFIFSIISFSFFISQKDKSIIEPPIPVNSEDFNTDIEVEHRETLKHWIYQDSINNFTNIESELLERQYIDKNYRWINKKTELIEFILIIKHNNLLRNTVMGKKKQDFHYRQFFSRLYGFGKTGLTETAKKHKPSLDLASIPFLWIKNHLNK